MSQMGQSRVAYLPLFIFIIYCSFMLDMVLMEVSQGVEIQYRTTGGLHNQQWFKGESFVKEKLICDLLFADGCALAVHSIEEISAMLDSLCLASKAFGLTISIKKFKLLHQPRLNFLPTFIPKVFVDGKSPHTVKSFTYLGSTITNDAEMDNKVEFNIGKVSSAFVSLYCRFRNSHDESLKTKIDIYKAVAVTSLLYGVESWTLYRKHITQLDSFHMHCLRQICKILWRDKIRNTVILSRCNILGMEAFLIKAQLRWCGHVIHMDNNHIPKQLLFGQISAPRHVGHPLLRYKDKLKDNPKRSQFDINNWETASNRNASVFFKGTD